LNGPLSRPFAGSGRRPGEPHYLQPVYYSEATPAMTKPTGHRMLWLPGFMLKLRPEAHV
jgi:hypothetical protein